MYRQFLDGSSHPAPHSYSSVLSTIVSRTNGIPISVHAMEIAQIELTAEALDRGDRLRPDQIDDLRALASHDLGDDDTRESRALQCLCSSMMARALRLEHEAAAYLQRCKEHLDEAL